MYRDVWISSAEEYSKHVVSIVDDFEKCYKNKFEIKVLFSLVNARPDFSANLEGNRSIGY